MSKLFHNQEENQVPIEDKPIEPNTPLEPKHKPWYIAAGFLLVILLGLTFIYSSRLLKFVNPNNIIKTGKDNFKSPAGLKVSTAQDAVIFSAFYSSSTSLSFTALLIDPKDGKIVDKKGFKIPDGLISDSISYVGDSDAIKFDPKTGDIYAYTWGASDYDGSCLNADGTCSNRIYRIPRNTSTPEIIYQDDEGGAPYWLLNYEKRLLLLLDIGSGGKLTMRTVNLDTGKQNIVIDKGIYKNSSTSLPSIVPIPSPDWENAYFAGEVKKASTTVYTIAKFNFDDSSIVQQDYTDYPTAFNLGDEGVNISPDGLLFYYAASPLFYTKSDTKVAEYNDIVNNDLGRYLGWGGGGHWLMYDNGREISYFDPVIRKVTKVTSHSWPIRSLMGSGYGYDLLSHDDIISAYPWGSASSTPIGKYEKAMQMFAKSDIGFPLDNHGELGNATTSLEQKDLFAETSGWKTYSNLKTGILFSYPEAWKIEKENSTSVYFTSDWMKKAINEYKTVAAGSHEAVIDFYDNIQDVPEIQNTPDHQNLTSVDDYYSFITKQGTYADILPYGIVDGPNGIEAYDFMRIDSRYPSSFPKTQSEFILIPIQGKIARLTFRVPGNMSSTIYRSLVTSFGLKQ